LIASETSESLRYRVRTLGCKANLFDSQLIEAELQKRGWKPAEAGKETSAKICIVNSCTVTDEADSQSRKLASRLLRESPEATIVFTGCAAEVAPELMAASKGIHYVVANRDKAKLVELVLGQLAKSERPEKGELLGEAVGYEEMLSRHPLDREWPDWQSLTVQDAPLVQTATTRAFLKIQEGCNSFCTYCIIPYGRGPSRSLPPEEIVRLVNEQVAIGAEEVVITGTNIGDYGCEWEEPGKRTRDGLTKLFTHILDQTKLRRLRVSSLDPTEIESGLLKLMQEDERFCPHFHISLQNVNDRILRLMKRRYGRAEVENCLKTLASLSTASGRKVFVGMDLITGFPGETKEEFEEGLEWLAALPWNRLHVFPYSERKGTPATRLPSSVPQAERVRRARLLQKLSFDRVISHYETVLNEQSEPLEEILLERHGGRIIEGRRFQAGYTPDYLRVLVTGELPQESDNRIIKAKVIGMNRDSASGEASLLSEISTISDR
jgi:threonylcarbamoyladenosine tRNA methylthiotransferase MtaB